MHRLEPLTHIFDRLQSWWDHPRTVKQTAALFIYAFLAGFAVIQCNQWGFLDFFPQPIKNLVPTNHFQTVHLAFTMLLFVEVMSLIFILTFSVSQAIGKQLEILALILLRNAFKQLTDLHEPINFALDQEIVLKILVSSLGALAVFICLGIYRRMPRFHNTMTPEDVMGYVMTKKIISLGLLLAVLVLLLRTAWHGISILALDAWGTDPAFLATAWYPLLLHTPPDGFFESIYTTLIFADILMVLAAQRYLPNFQAMFRNSGYVIATLLMRLSFAAPVYMDTIIGVAASIYALLLTWAVHFFFQAPKTGKEKTMRQQRV